jgi:hypothetical protein
MLRVAHAGKLGRVLWLADRSGDFLGQEYYNGLDRVDRAKFRARFERLTEFGRITNQEHFNNEEDGIWCFKASAHRLACFLDQSDAIVTHGFRKQSQKMPPTQKARAVRLREYYREAVSHE